MNFLRMNIPYYHLLIIIQWCRVNTIQSSTGWSREGKMLQKYFILITLERKPIHRSRKHQAAPNCEFYCIIGGTQNLLLPANSCVVESEQMRLIISASWADPASLYKLNIYDNRIKVSCYYFCCQYEYYAWQTRSGNGPSL